MATKIIIRHAQKIGHEALDHIFAIWIVFLSDGTASFDDSSGNLLFYPFSHNLLLKIFREKIRDMKSLERKYEKQQVSDL